MAQWGRTNFTEFIGDHSPDEAYSQEISRAVRKLDVIPGTVAARQQAVADFLGYAETVEVLSGDDTRKIKYISRGTPLPYVYSPTIPSLFPLGQYLYAANITRGEAIGAPTNPTIQGLTGGPAGQAGGTGVGGNFSRYRYTVEFTTRTYDILPDSAVAAVQGAAKLVGRNGSGRPTGDYVQTPLFDFTAKVGYPDEGQALAGVSFFGVLAGADFTSWPGLGNAWPRNPPTWSSNTRYITRYFRPSSRMRVLPFGMLHWQSDNVPIREGFPFSEGLGTLQICWHAVPEDGIPLFAIGQAADHINDDWFDGYSPETLLFKSADFRRYRDPLGQILYNVEYNFSYMPHVSLNPLDNGLPTGWNSQLRAKGSPVVLNYEQVVDDNTNAGGGRRPYPTFDMSKLFRPDQPTS